MKNVKFSAFIILILIEAIIMIIAGSSLTNTISNAASKKSFAYKNSFDTAYSSQYTNSYKLSYDENFSAKYDDSYHAAYDEQYKRSYDTQYQTSYNIEYTLNYNSSYNTNYYKSYKPAYDSNWETSYHESYSEGQTQGIIKGTQDGKTDGEKTKVPLRNPTYQELIAFLASDRTDQKTYNELNYNCTDYSSDLDNNAELAGIDAAFVLIEFPQEPGHAIVAFKTTDKGIVYIEPQRDNIVNLQKGKAYHQCEVPPPGYYMIPPLYDDTVVDFTVIW